MMRRLWAYLFGGPVYWCRYGHHWTHEPLPFDIKWPHHFTRWFCSVCWWRWMEH